VSAAADRPNQSEVEQRYARAWRRLRIFRRVGIAMFLALPVIVVGSLPFDCRSCLFAAWAATMGLAMVANVAHALVGCPRCGKRFTNTWYWSNPWTARCLHCGLPKGSSAASDAERVRAASTTGDLRGHGEPR
jgi:hypothetical protein